MTDCVLCARWALTPFAKRYTTPTTAQETEAALTLGFHVAQAHAGTAPRLCARHSAFLFQLDAIDAANERAAHAAPAPPTPQQLAFQARADAVVKQLSGPIATGSPMPLPSALHMATPTTLPVPPPPAQAFQPPQQGQLVPSQETVPIMPFPEGATEGAKTSFPCPICHQPAVSGELHQCG